MSVASRYFQVYGDTDLGFKPFNVLDPGEVYRWCIANNVDPSPFWGKANRIVDYIGFNPQPSYLLVGGAGAAEMYRQLKLSNGTSYYRMTSSHVQVLIHDSQLNRTLSQASWVPKTALGFDQLYVSSMEQIGPNGDGNAAYLMTLNDSRYFAGDPTLCGNRASVTNLTALNFNVAIPGQPQSDGYMTGAYDNWQAIWNIVESQTYQPRSWGLMTLPTITEVASNFSVSGNRINALKYICELHNRAFHLNIRLVSTTNSLGALIELGTESTSITNIMDTWAAQGRQVFKHDSRQEEYYLEYPVEFQVFFQKKYLPIAHQYSLYQELFEYQHVSATPAVPASVDDFDGIYSTRICQLHSPEFAEINITSATANNDAALDTLADEYQTRFLPRLTTANKKLHRIFSGVIDNIPIGNQVHEIVWRDYGDSDGMVTEVRGGREVLLRLLGPPLEMLSKPLAAHPDLGFSRRPEAVNTTRAIGKLTAPTTNTSLSTTIYTGTPGAETSTGIAVTAYYIGPTIAAGTKRVQVWAGNGGGTQYYSV